MSRRETAKLPLRSPRTWHGMTLGIWLRLLASESFSVSPTRVPMCCAITAVSCFNSTGAIIENWWRGRLADQQPLEHPPLFIVGHWRTGTTLLHELLVRDKQFAYPTTYQCMAPHHFLHTESYIPKIFGFVLPKQRPMDNMSVGWSRPQEDEFALCNLGVPSPYLYWAFPDRACRWDHYLDLDGVEGTELEVWKATLIRFLRRLQFSDRRRMVLKSPTHTARLGLLSRMFPQSQFIHMVRNPFEVVPSTLRTFQRMGDVLGLRARIRDDLEDHVFGLYQRMYRRFERDRQALGDERFVELRYEDLVADPVTQLDAIYQQLQLGDFASVRPQVQAYFEETRDYQPNRHSVSEPLLSRIKDVWSDYLSRYEYAVP